MSGDEVVVLLLCLGATFIVWPLWFWKLSRVGMVSDSRPRWFTFLGPVAGAFVLLHILLTLADAEVRANAEYAFLYLMMGAAWVGGGTLLLPLFGICARDDAAERHNWASAIVVCGAIVALSLAFAGANIGDGPGWWVVVFSAALSTAALLLAWFVLARFTRLADALTIDRDVPAGLRAAGFLIAMGLILGSAAAGDWVSGGDTIADFVVASWPVLPMLGLAMVLELIFRPTPENPGSSFFLQGIMPAVVYLGLALAAVIMFNDWAKSTGAW
jgi:hypothetical protein